ncbi:chromogranin-A [Seriola aureovittata]|uniref:chromogranin-A n=1 Tax=Seriola aureovittata TaxID=2871759 RepID=UPI0024BEA219|nr:chromogranin-A [Seriola aureovittata]
MIGRGLFVLTILSNCVLSLPVTSGQLENEDVKVMKCVVEALADVLSRPHPVPVSQECLVTLKTDDRLVTILRHHNFLKELQEIALQGGQETVQLQRDAARPDTMTQTPQTTDDIADRSMLEALGGPGERSILLQTRRTGNGDGEGEKDESRRDGESREDNDITEEVQVKRQDDESTGSPVSESVDEWNKGKAEKREEEEQEEEYEAKRANSEENSEEGNKDKKGAGSDEKRDDSRNKSKEKKSDEVEEEEEEEEKKRSALFSHKQEGQQGEEGEMKRGSRESLKRWTKRGKGLQLKRKADGKEAQQLNGQQEEVPHHSKEVTEDDDEEEKKKKRDTQRSPEEKELQMIARRGPEDRRVSEEEGSASRKAEEPEIESLAAIESELENVAQKLHELRRG